MAKIENFILTIIICWNIVDHHVKCDQFEISDNRNDGQIKCTLNCMLEQQFTNKSVIKNCFYKQCRNKISDSNDNQLKRFASNINLLCRDRESLTIEFVQFNQTFDVIYVIKINNDNNRIILSDSSILTINQLNSSTIYNITGEVLMMQQHNDNDNDIDNVPNSLIAKTLSDNHTPENVTHLYIEFTSNPDTNKLNAIIEWQQPKDLLCNYKILWYSTSVDDSDGIQHVEELLYDQEFLLTNLNFDHTYIISVQPFYKFNYHHESALIKNFFTTPTCLKTHANNISYCPPAKPENITVTPYYVAPQIYNFNITWNRPDVDPISYIINIADNVNFDEVKRNVTGNETTIFMENIKIIGTNYMVVVTAISPIGNTSSYTEKNLDSIFNMHATNNAKLRITLSILIPISLVITFLVSSIIYTNRQQKIDKINKRIAKFNYLNNNAPDEPVLNGEEQEKKTRIERTFIGDKMEVKSSDVEIFEKIGEGAFGYVQRGCLKPNNKMVAVKMLKNSPSIDEISEFFGEIVVMKQVGHHPNIVGIIGHSTKNVYHMMLLIEYCSEGNLLDFLRNIWQQLPLDAINSPILPTTPTIGTSSTPVTYTTKSPELAFNFDTSFTNKYAREYKSVLSSPPQPQPPVCDFAVNLAYEHNLHPNQQSPASIIETNDKNTNNEIDNKKLPTSHVENPSYIDVENLPGNNILNNSSIIIDQSRKNSAIELSYIDLLQFAKQIAEGMAFLSLNKIVHRDLAARNVLVCSDKKVKISDFGLSRDIYQKNMYLKSGDGKLPLKWLAIESLTHQIYTTYSDVWSYGILLYEIMTLGSTPYPSIDAVQLLEFLLNGYRMDRPRNCDVLLYQLMKGCWEKDPNDRPSFVKIINIMDVFIANEMSKLK